MLAYSTKNVTTLESMEAPALGGEWFKNLIETQAYRIEIQWGAVFKRQGSKTNGIGSLILSTSIRKFLTHFLVEVLLHACGFYEFLSVRNAGTFLRDVLQSTASSVRMRWDPI